MFTWGSQFYITCIETILIILVYLMLTIIEFRTGKILDYDPLAGQDMDDEFAGMSLVEINRKKQYKRVIELMRNGEDVTGFAKGMNNRDNLSLPDRFYFSDASSQLSKAYTFPLNPDEEEEMMKGDFLQSRMRMQDNVYADSQAYDAARNMCDKETNGTQTFSNTADYMKFINREDPILRQYDQKKGRRR